MVPLFIGVMNIGAAHSLLSSPIHLISPFFLILYLVLPCIPVNRESLSMVRWRHVFDWKFTVFVPQFSWVPFKSFWKLNNKSNKDFHLLSLRCLQHLFTTSCRSAFLYFTSKSQTIYFVDFLILSGYIYFLCMFITYWWSCMTENDWTGNKILLILIVEFLKSSTAFSSVIVSLPIAHMNYFTGGNWVIFIPI